jgi:lipid II:glycine glycyltransferase (peptidoglycan interpeptide bridge formation enzyme)
MKADRTIRLVTDSEKLEWNSVVHHPLQSWEWGEFRKAMGIDVARVGVYEKNTLIEGWQITFHAIPFLPYTIGYFPKGPRPRSEMIDELKKLGIQKRAIYIQLEPDITAEESSDVLRHPSLVSSYRPLFTKYTFVLDLTKTEEELMAAMHSKTRYNIRVAQKHGVVIAEDNSDKAFATYLALSEETTRRQGFYAHNRHYHKTMWNILHRGGIARLFTASYNCTIIATWILFVWKDTLYYPYGASSRTNRDVMAPNLLLWEIVRWAKKQQLFYFDLWGALGPNPDPNDPWSGFHRFKEGYKPTLVEFAGSYDLKVYPLLYTLFTWADSIRWMLLKLKSKH